MRDNAVVGPRSGPKTLLDGLLQATRSAHKFAPVRLTDELVINCRTTEMIAASGIEPLWLLNWSLLLERQRFPSEVLTHD